MPRILDLFDNTVHEVSQDVYDSWIVQSSRFQPAPKADPAPAVIEQGRGSASDLVGTPVAPCGESAAPVAVAAILPDATSAPDAAPEPIQEN